MDKDKIVLWKYRRELWLSRRNGLRQRAMGRYLNKVLAQCCKDIVRSSLGLQM